MIGPDDYQEGSGSIYRDVAAIARPVGLLGTAAAC